ncbi:MAG: preprotein translocase subunit SecA [Pelagibacteraceae bacterium TMED65]|nr:preprotein translocase subunit SecA [Rickettsiales bacterium]OUU51225.1 MAG: preprotein translocase subunit SecA [Pelagibacteraceae bacterium TMED65]|tara:strand:- start:3025 stop:5577 length:2553 start_codon:yes stop_codon:yes gene_type:complete
MLNYLSKKIFGSSNDRIIKQIIPIVENVNALEKKYEKFSDQDIIKKTKELNEMVSKGRELEEIIPDAFANVREAAKRSLGQRHYDVQIIGGIVLHRGMIAEMKTGEGKTLVSTLAAYLNSLNNKSVHIVTVNDYLAKRDSEWMGNVYERLGLETGFLLNGMSEDDRKKAYSANITYGTNNEFGFDYLRDNMKFAKEQIVQSDFNYAIIDEVDSILIDEARTPLIISGAAEESSALYNVVDKIISRLNPEDYEKDEKSKSVVLNDDAVEKLENLYKEQKLLNEGSLYDINNVTLLHHTNQSLKARYIFEKDKDYLVQDGKVLIVDEFTGRAMEGRRFSEGIHQAIEAKENLQVQVENQTLASITYQNYFRLYKKLSGMTGTAKTEADEFFDIYKLDVVEVPTNKSMVRVDHEDEIYRTLDEKHDAIVDLIQDCVKQKQPCLVGTVSIEKSETLSKILQKKKINHQVLNAKNHLKEAEIIANAGKPGTVTIATNMAGRGTDIQLGGAQNPEDKNDDKKIAKNVGGLYIIGTERHESRRIDNQLRGRSGRQGDPGSSKFFLSLEDDLMRIFGSEKLDSVLQTLGLSNGESIQHPWITKALERAQKKVEARNFEIRKSLLRFDDVMNEQRKIIYEQRREIINEKDIDNLVFDMRDTYVEDLINNEIKDLNELNDEKKEKIIETCKQNLNVKLDLENLISGTPQIEDIKEEIIKLSDKNINLKKTKYSDEVFAFAQKTILLQIIDKSWKEHLLSLDHLRQGISLRAYGQKDPLNEYKQEAFIMFEEMMERIRFNITKIISFIEIKTEAPPPEKSAPDVSQSNEKQCLEDSGNKKIPRNAVCPRTGKKYKRCCGKI